MYPGETIWQPSTAIDTGICNIANVSLVFEGDHIWPNPPASTISGRPRTAAAAARRWHIGFVGRTVLDYGTSTHFYEGWGCGIVCVTHTIAVQNRCGRIVGLDVDYKRRALNCLDPSWFWR